MASQEPEQENLWNKILSEASRSVSDRLETKTVLVLGDKNCGKSTLISRLQGLDASETRKGIALDYSFIDIPSSEADDDTVARLNIWQLEGESEHNNLLRFALNPSTISNSMVIIALDFSQPWNLVESLNRWLGVLQKHISSISIQLPPGEHQELKNSLVYDFQNYIDPSSSTTKAVPTKKKRPVDEQALLPLKEGVLTNNFGIPIMVVCCKTDHFLLLEKEFNYKDSHFDYIQQYLRRICLSYGASLVYTSAKKDRNCDLLLRYMRNLLYNFEFDVKPQLQEKDILFVPMGADSTAKISVEFENQSLTKDVDEPFEDIIKIPRRLQQTAAAVDPIIVADDDQEFLNKHKDVIEKDKAADAKKPSKDGALLQTLQKFNTTPTTESLTTGTAASPATPKPPATSLLTGIGVSPDKSAVPPVSSIISDSGKSGSSTNDHQVLSDFFNSLINKDPHRPSLSTTGLNRKPGVGDLKTSTGALPGTKSSSSLPINREEMAKKFEQLKSSTKNSNS